MSRDERHGSRSLIYSKWHRLFLGDAEPMIDLDGVEYCNQRGCNGITRFRVRRVHPPGASRMWEVMTPEEFRDRLRTVRLNHLAAEHHTWGVAG